MKGIVDRFSLTGFAAAVFGILGGCSAPRDNGLRPEEMGDSPDTPQMLYGLEVFDQGDGPALLLWNGTGLDHRLWERQHQAWSRNHRLVRFNPPGFGNAPVPEGPYDLRESVAQVMDSLGIDEVTAIGQSGGGAQCLDFALQHSDRVDRLVLIATGVSGWKIPEAELERFAAYARLAQQGYADELVETMLDDPYVERAARSPENRLLLEQIYRENENAWNPAIYRWAKNVQRPALERLHELDRPVLLIVGEHDLDHILEISDRLDAGIGQSELVHIEGGHLLPMENPEVLNELVLDWLRHAPQ